jgi:hypothetical protein
MSKTDDEHGLQVVRSNAFVVRQDGTFVTLSGYLRSTALHFSTHSGHQNPHVIAPPLVILDHHKLKPSALRHQRARYRDRFITQSAGVDFFLSLPPLPSPETIVPHVSGNAFYQYFPNATPADEARYRAEPNAGKRRLIAGELFDRTWDAIDWNSLLAALNDAPYPPANYFQHPPQQGHVPPLKTRDAPPRDDAAEEFFWSEFRTLPKHYQHALKHMNLDLIPEEQTTESLNFTGIACYPQNLAFVGVWKPGATSMLQHRGESVYRRSTLFEELFHQLDAHRFFSDRVDWRKATFSDLIHDQARAVADLSVPEHKRISEQDEEVYYAEFLNGIAYMYHHYDEVKPRLKQFIEHGDPGAEIETSPDLQKKFLTPHPGNPPLIDNRDAVMEHFFPASFPLFKEQFEAPLLAQAAQLPPPPSSHVGKLGARSGDFASRA